MSEHPWTAIEMQDGGTLGQASYCFVSDPSGWIVRRNNTDLLKLEAAYRKLQTISCGVCATDLARPYLPFPLPQVIGHEVLAKDADGQRFVLDINASCAALEKVDPCDMCTEGMPTHCRRRLTLGINQLPGGFGPWVLVPPGAQYPVPSGVTDDTAVLAEPFAAALHAVDSVSLQDGDEVCVLGPRRLGMLVIAALDGRRRQKGLDITITAMVRRPELGDLARTMGADALKLSDSEGGDAQCDVVFDTTGNPQALTLAARMARRELHLKSTHGRGAAGLDQLTGFVVDELTVAPHAPSSVDTPRLQDLNGKHEPRSEVPVLSVASDAEFDQAIRPVAGDEVSWMKPRGLIVADSAGSFASPVLRQVRDSGLLISSSRCGDFSKALELLDQDERMRTLGAIFVSHRFAQHELEAAMKCAASRNAIKVVVDAEV